MTSSHFINHTLHYTHHFNGTNHTGHHTNGYHNDSLHHNNSLHHMQQNMPPPIIPLWFHKLIFALYILLSCVGGIGNFLVCLVLIRRKQRVRSIHLLTLNLAVSDLIVCIIYVPTQMYQIQVNYLWDLGVIACGVSFGVNSCTVNASIGTLIVITYDRYVAVTQPMVAHQRNTKRTKILIFVVWLISGLITIPLMIVADIHQGYCTEHWPSREMGNIYWVIIFVVQLPLPMLYIVAAYCIIVYAVKSSHSQFELVKLHNDLQKQEERKLRNGACCHNDTNNNKDGNQAVDMDESVFSSRFNNKTRLPNRNNGRRLSVTRRKRRRSSNGSRKKQQNKLLKMSIILVIAYTVCVTPQHAVFFAATYGTLALKPYAAFFFIVSNFLMSLNSAINPLIYGTLNDEMKKSLVRLFKCSSADDNKLTRNVSSALTTLRETIRLRFKPSSTFGKSRLLQRTRNMTETSAC
ncbi:galanin receptor type 1-like [Clytia hemisphaerica]|uniref:galanin receptor type 1-like n=1 Tax=Clytia hemisphaerica TaxID=252671 RepID=UPI0034D3CD7D|eukprot:TCONS_00065060-protein